MTVAPGFVRLTCDDPSLNIVVRLGEDPVQVTAGAGGWEMTVWNGVEPVQVSLPLMFDGYAAGSSQEKYLRKLFTVARGDDDSPPGVLSVEGVYLPADEWVVEGVDYGTPILATTMNRLRQPLTLTLREYVPPSYLKLRRRSLSAPKNKTKVITTRKGDTPASIARRQHCKWTDLRQLNPKAVTKANQKLKTGTKLRVPVAKTTTKKAKGLKGRK
jgi:hypothetical protein